MELFVKSRLSPAAIHKIIQKKWKLEIRYSDVYARVQEIRKELNVGSERELSGLSGFVELLEREKLQQEDRFRS